MLYFRKGKPTTLSRMTNWELEGILLHIKKYPKGLLNGYDKQQYIDAVNYILKERLPNNNFNRNVTESRLANKALEASNELTNLILKCMINTEKKSTKKLILK